MVDTAHMDRGVVFDNTQTYRYVLTRRWGGKRGQVCFIMLNPSTADCFEEDATIRRCISFADSWGWHSIMVVNLFAFRATQPADLFKAEEPVGPRNDDYIERACETSEVIVCAWGFHKKAEARSLYVRQDLLWPFYQRRKCLGKTAAGFPRHPCRLAKNTALEDF